MATHRRANRSGCAEHGDQAAAEIRHAWPRPSRAPSPRRHQPSLLVVRRQGRRQARLVPHALLASRHHQILRSVHETSANRDTQPGQPRGHSTLTVPGDSHGWVSPGISGECAQAQPVPGRDRAAAPISWDIRPLRTSLAATTWQNLPTHESTLWRPYAPDRLGRWLAPSRERCQPPSVALDLLGRIMQHFIRIYGWKRQSSTT